MNDVGLVSFVSPEKAKCHYGIQKGLKLEKSLYDMLTMQNIRPSTHLNGKDEMLYTLDAINRELAFLRVFSNLKIAGFIMVSENEEYFRPNCQQYPKIGDQIVTLKQNH